MVAVLVREHVGLRKRPALGAEPRLQLVEEAEIDVDLLVGRAVERADLRARVAAPRLHRVGVEDRLRGRVAAHRGLPVGLDAVDVGDDPAVLPLVCVSACLAVLAECRRRAGRDRLAVEAPEPAGAATPREDHVEDEDHEADDPEPTAAGEHGPAHAAAATYVRDLRGVELGAASESHRIFLPGTGTLTPDMVRFNRLVALPLAAVAEPAGGAVSRKAS